MVSVVTVTVVVVVVTVLLVVVVSVMVLASAYTKKYFERDFRLHIIIITRSAN